MRSARQVHQHRRRSMATIWLWLIILFSMCFPMKATTDTICMSPPVRVISIAELLERNSTGTTATTVGNNSEGPHATVPEASALDGLQPSSNHNDFCLDVQNTTNLNTQATGLLQRKANCTIFQEHSLDWDELASVNNFCAGNGYRPPKCGPTDPEHTRASAGVGFIIARPHNAIDVPPQTDSFKDAVATGRCNHHAIEIGCSTTVSVYNLYGWTGGHTNPIAAGRTNKLVCSCHAEMDQHPPGPRLLVGDLNAEPEDLVQLMHMTTEEHWVDIGKHADKWGKQPEQNTCKAPNATDATRRDFIFANNEALALIKDFQVIDDQLFPVHATLRLILRGDRVLRYR